MTARVFTPARRTALEVLAHAGTARESNVTAEAADGHPATLYWQTRAWLTTQGLIESVSADRAVAVHGAAGPGPWYELTPNGALVVDELFQPSAPSPTRAPTRKDQPVTATATKPKKASAKKKTPEPWIPRLATTFESVPIAKVEPGSDNIRHAVHTDEDFLASVRELGILQPLLVSNGDDGYTVIAGHRRLAAAQIVGLAEIPVVVTQLTDAAERDRVVRMLAENLHREDLSTIEKAEGFARLIKLGFKQSEIAKAVGCNQGTVSKHLKLLELPETAQRALEAGALIFSDALELTKLNAHPKLLDKAWADASRTGISIGAAVAREQAHLDRDKRVAGARADLEAQGVAVIDHPGGYNWQGFEQRPLAGQPGADFPTVPLTAADHSPLPCHGAAVNREGDIVWLCLDPSLHAATSADTQSSDDEDDDDDPENKLPLLPPGSKAKKAKAPQLTDEEVAQRERDALFNAAAEARREAICTIVRGRPKKPAVTDYLLVRAICSLDRNEVFPVDTAAALGLELPSDDPWDFIEEYAFESGDHLVAVGLTRALIATEMELTLAGPDSWAHDRLAERHFAFLSAHGYELLPVEAEALKPKEPAQA